MTQSRQSTTATNYLELLPLELICMISNNLGHDLVAHVTFSTLRPDIYEFCYKDKSREFWRHILRASGLSTLERSQHDDESLVSPGDWEKLARECVAHAEVCKHPKCGMARLRENEELMRASVNSGIPLMDTLDPSDEDDQEVLWELPDEALSFSTAIDTITFKTREFELLLPEETWRSAAFVRHGASGLEEQDSLQYGDEFVHHPILWRSFFAFPPIAGFRVTCSEWERAIAPRNDDGIIFADVLQNILEIDKSCNVDGLDFFEAFYDSPDFCEFEEEGKEPEMLPQSWTFIQKLRALGSFRNWFMLVRWVGLEVNEVDLGEIFCTMHFKAQNLPEKYKDFVRLTTYSHKPQP